MCWKKKINNLTPQNQEEEEKKRKKEKEREREKERDRSNLSTHFINSEDIFFKLIQF